MLLKTSDACAITKVVAGGWDFCVDIRESGDMLCFQHIMRICDIRISVQKSA
jgi:hypothetical protein